MKCWRPFVFLSAAICGIVFFALAIQDVFAGTPGDQRTARRSFLQSTLGVRGNFELYVPQDQAITHYWRYNDVPWFPWFAATDKLVYPCATWQHMPPASQHNPHSEQLYPATSKPSFGSRRRSQQTRIIWTSGRSTRAGNGKDRFLSSRTDSR
jgi:hypothetical protein